MTADIVAYRGRGGPGGAEDEGIMRCNLSPQFTKDTLAHGSTEARLQVAAGN